MSWPEIQFWTGGGITSGVDLYSGSIKSGANTAASTFLVVGSLGTGTGAAGSIVFQTGVPQVAGSTQHVPATVLTLKDSGTGGVSAPQALFADGAAATPAWRFSSYNHGFYSDGITSMSVVVNGARQAYFTTNGGFSLLDNAGTYKIGASQDVILGRGAAATLQLGAAAANSDGVDQTLQTQGGITGTDRAAGDLTIQTGVGTGTGASSIIFKAPTPQATGTTPQTHATVLTLKDSGTGGTSAPQAIFADGLSTAPSISFSGAPTYGFRRSSTSVVLQIGGLTGWTSSANAFAIGGANLNLRNDSGTPSSFASLAQHEFTLGGTATGTPAAQTLQAQGGSGTDIAGASLTIQSGAGTGAAAGSALTFKTPTVGGSGTGAQTQTTRLVIGEGGIDVYRNVYPQAHDTYKMGSGSLAWTEVGVSRATLGSKSKTLTDATPVAFATIPMADGVATGGKLIYRVVATNGGTQRQVVSGSINYAAVRDGATYAVDYDEIQQSTAVTTGTLTGSVTAAGASDLLTFSANFDTDLATPVITLYYRFDSTDTLAITPL